ncbi:uncharacterized protein K460DRAFT_359100 [Cucurbitaria berberidis CBS 394.84]|uniref:Altered inheritance of mitochondria protein 21 n=1 Tax=Cucurbitaria berberidis CBS 394.84 TaxID=1168544 RepID=A0A9P4GBV7_9PLEO|nr:uncharacterized protein K460DRAFT_359100 [Cucurbitaria berberidis CBS 394.84]KAF1842501.1 hypothetical protein K460DRAFT_359100 [Cucurbitaria berberidis CBS 394.84]
MSAPPAIPPRPARAQNSPAPAPSSQLDTPKIPPRPKRGIERSVSPSGDRYAPSPLNDPTYLHSRPASKDGSRLTAEVPSRPPSVSMPSLGEEGNEYASFDDLSKTLTDESINRGGSPQHKNIAGDLPLHAPTASVPSSTAKSRIQLVTRTDSSQAEAAGFGKQLSVDEKIAQSTKTGRSGSSVSSRPSSLYNDKEEQGIPEIGVQVPMFRNAGDVQAPSPAPSAQQSHSSRAGFHQKSGGRHHGRTKSGREIFHGPPGSYGMHGHGVISNHEFEQKWYERHPEDLKREKAGEYGPHIQENRKDYHWRADNLEKLVHTRAQDIGMGTSREAASTPDEHIGFMASDQYASRMASPRPAPSGRPASIKAGYTDSPLRNEAGEEVNEAGEVIHIDPPAHRSNKIHGTNYDNKPTEDLGPEGGNTAKEGGWVTEHGYGTPILASDELEKHPEAEWRQPAVSPELERHGDEYLVNEDGTPAYTTKGRSHSRNSSLQAQRAITSPTHFDRGSTPLESHKEYEPLFPEEHQDTKRPKSQVDKLKRPSARHQFPSQDVWEDTPGSLQLETTVETPEAPEEPETPVGDNVDAAKVFEKPETEEQRKTDITDEDQQSFLPEHTRRFAVENKHLGKVRDDTVLRPGLQQRFPSQDIWEDAPSHGHLETTVSTPQIEETNDYADDSPVSEKPGVPARPNIPLRPAKKEFSPIDKKGPIIPDRPKPQIPARPSKPSTGSSDKVPTVESQASENEAPLPKAKPPVPARPAGSKIAALQAGFLKDLNSKLGLGPQAPKVQEPEPEQQEEAAPLQDARKGRAKGPQRRKPAASPTPAATITAEVAVPRVKLDLAPVTAIWSFGEDGALDVPAAKLAASLSKALKPTSSAKSDEPEPEPELAKITTRDSEPASTLETTTSEALSALAKPASQVSSTFETSASKASSTVEESVAKAASAVESEEPVVSETVRGSVDAPGAFPGSGPDLEDEDGAKGGISLEKEPSTEKLEKEVELPTAAAPVAASAEHDVVEKEGAGHTQSLAG